MNTEEFVGDWLEDANGVGDESDEDVNDRSLGRLSKLAEQARKLEKEIADEMKATAEKTDKLDKIKRDLMPSLMEELGIAKFDLTDGSKIELKDVINANITEINKPAAFAWLEARGDDGIIKTKVTSEFGKGEIEKAREACDALIAAGFAAPVMDRSVHFMTLRSYVKEKLEEGIAIPTDTFGIFQYKEAKITAPKAKRK